MIDSVETNEKYEFSVWILNSTVYFHYDMIDIFILVQIDLLKIMEERKIIGKILIYLYFYKTEMMSVSHLTTLKLLDQINLIICSTLIDGSVWVFVKHYYPIPMEFYTSS